MLLGVRALLGAVVGLRAADFTLLAASRADMREIPRFYVVFFGRVPAAPI